VTEALELLLSRMEGNDRLRASSAEKAPALQLASDMGPTIFEDPETPPPPVFITEAPWDGADGGEVIPPSVKATGGIVISKPIDVEKVANELAERIGHPVRPVPKPTRKPRTRR
jgi:hypothetical protein